MKEEIELNEHKRVGPYTDVGDHAPVTFLQTFDETGTIVEDLWFCLDCGYTARDRRYFHENECNREDNRVAQTWREYLENAEFPE